MARRFVFRLDPLLKLRKACEKDQQRVVADGVRRVQQCLRELADLQSAQANALVDARRMRRQARIDVRWAVQENRWRACLGRRIEPKEDELRGLERALAEKREELVRRSRDVKVLENLRQRRLDAHRRELERTERVELDELATQVFLRTGRESATLMQAVR